MLRYIQRHWRGQQTLGWSFWVNLVGVRVLLFMLQDAAGPAEGSDFHAYRYLVFIAVVVLHLLLLIWQLVGVVRAADAHFAEHGNMALVWGAQLGAVLMFILSAVYALGAVQMTHGVPDEMGRLASMDEEHASRYALILADNNTVLTLRGSIELGITRAVAELVAVHKGLTTLVLDSAGGNIYEARGLAKLLREHEFATHVSASCASACTIVFSGGSVRTAQSGATFGFHQYRVDADYTIIATDVVKEQKRDEQLFLEAGVSQLFVDQVFSQPSLSMWWPDLRQLTDAGFLHRVVY